VLLTVIETEPKPQFSAETETNWKRSFFGFSQCHQKSVFGWFLAY